MHNSWLEEFEREEWVELFRPLLEVAVAPSERHRRIHQFNLDFKAFQQHSGQGSGYRLSIKDGVTLIRMIGSEIEIGERRIRILGNVALFLETLRHPNFVVAIENQYPDYPLGQRADLLCVLACQEPRLAAASLKRIIATHGFPNAYPRVFWKLSEHTTELHHYVLEFLRDPGRHVGDAVDLINRAIEKKHLNPAQLDELASLIEKKTEQLIQAATAAEDTVRNQWRRDEGYFYLRIKLGAWLDLLGIVRACDAGVLQQALQLEDPLINLFLVVALISKGLDVPRDTIMKAACSYETLRGLYKTLDAKNHLHLFPDEYASFEHFAAAEMVEWLLYPSELGEEPKNIELMSTIDGQGKNGTARHWCLWRFTNSDDESFAGVSGPYDENAHSSPTPGSVTSNDVFSNFEPWESATPEEYLSEVLETLSSWRIAHCDGKAV